MLTATNCARYRTTGNCELHGGCLNRPATRGSNQHGHPISSQIPHRLDFQHSSEWVNYCGNGVKHAELVGTAVNCFVVSGTSSFPQRTIVRSDQRCRSNGFIPTHLTNWNLGLSSRPWVATQRFCSDTSHQLETGAVVPTLGGDGPFWLLHSVFEPMQVVMMPVNGALVSVTKPSPYSANVTSPLSSHRHGTWDGVILAGVVLQLPPLEEALLASPSSSLR